MNLKFQGNGNLSHGHHLMTIEEFENNFGYNDHRRKLISGLKKGMAELRDCGCCVIYIDGSFVSTKEIPADFDACWNLKDVDLIKLQRKYPLLVDFENERENQKKTYLGEFFPAEIPASKTPLILFFDFFQKDKDGNPKGIVQINLK